MNNLVGERGFEPSTPRSRTNNRFTNLLSRLGLFCVLHHVSSWYSAANGPKLDPSLSRRALPPRSSGGIAHPVVARRILRTIPPHHHWPISKPRLYTLLHIRLLLHARSPFGFPQKDPTLTFGKGTGNEAAVCEVLPFPNYSTNFPSDRIDSLESMNSGRYFVVDTLLTCAILEPNLLHRFFRLLLVASPTYSPRSSHPKR